MEEPSYVLDASVTPRELMGVLGQARGNQRRPLHHPLYPAAVGRLDREAPARVRGQMEEPSFVLDAPCTPRELMGVLGQAHLCLAMRLHTLIFQSNRRGSFCQENPPNSPLDQQSSGNFVLGAV